MPEMRDKVVFEWQRQWYAVDNSFRKHQLKYVRLPNNTILEHSGKYETLVLLSYADYAVGFKLVPEDTNLEANTIVPAEKTEEQLVAGDETSGYGGDPYPW